MQRSHQEPRTAHGQHAEPAGIPKERVAGLFDGIVAITATLLTLEFGVPVASGELALTDLAASGSAVLHWGVSFIMVAVIWTEFHFVFAHTRRWDGVMMTLTFCQMALISLIPFASELVGDNPGSFIATLVFTVIMGANGLMVSANNFVLQRKEHLHSSEHSRHALYRRRRAQAQVYPLFVIVSLIAAWLHDPIVGELVWALCPLALATHVRRDARTPPDRTPRTEVTG